MSIVADRAEELETALTDAAGLRCYRDPGATVDPPAAILMAPMLTWEGTCADPTGARFLIYVVVGNDEYALPRLWELAPRVAKAVDAVPAAVVTTALPGTYNAGGTDLPAYEFTVEVSV